MRTTRARCVSLYRWRHGANFTRITFNLITASRLLRRHYIFLSMPYTGNYKLTRRLTVLSTQICCLNHRDTNQIIFIKSLGNMPIYFDSMSPVTDGWMRIDLKWFPTRLRFSMKGPLILKRCGSQCCYHQGPFYLHGLAEIGTWIHNRIDGLNYSSVC